MLDARPNDLRISYGPSCRCSPNPSFRSLTRDAAPERSSGPLRPVDCMRAS